MTDQEKIALLLRGLATLLRVTGNTCEYCVNYIPCDGKSCDSFQSGVGAVDEATGEAYPDFKWTCMDWDLGSCAKYEGTVCEKCLADDQGVLFEYNWQPVKYQ